MSAYVQKGQRASRKKGKKEISLRTKKDGEKEGEERAYLFLRLAQILQQQVLLDIAYKIEE